MPENTFDPSVQPDVIVVGAGVSGLTAALHLAERGLRPLVLEADPRYPGGRLAAKDPLEVDGWTFPGEHGVHGIWSGYLNLQAMLARRRIRPMLVPAQEEDWFYRRGASIKKAAIGSAIRESWVPAPFHYLNLFLRPSFLASIGPSDWLSLFGVWAGLVFALGIDPLREDQPLEGMTMHDIVGKWSPAVRSLFIGLARNGFAGQPDEIPLSGFLAFLRFYTVLRRDSWAFSYLPGDGGSKMIDPLVQGLEAEGGRVVLGARVKTVEPLNLPSAESGPGQGGEPARWQVKLEDGRELAARALVLALDANAARQLLEDSPATAATARDLYFPRGSATGVARIWFDDKPKYTSEAGIFCGDFVYDNFFWLDRIYEPFVRWSKATGGSAIEIHLYGPPEIFNEPDAALLARAINEVGAVFPELRGKRKYAAFQRNTTAHTLFGLGPANRHLAVKTPWPGLLCCGDWVRHPEPALFLERACVTGIAAANLILEERGLQPWPVLLYPPPEPLAGWIQALMVRGRQARRRRKSVEV